MSAAETAAALTTLAPRGPGSDAERRAAAWLAGQARGPGRSARVETFWCRPNGALAHAWHVALALAGSILMVSRPVLGGLLALAALACVVLDALTGRSPGRRLTPEHASQNVVSDPVREPEPEPARGSAAAAPALARTRLIVTGPYDTSRDGRVGGAPVRRAAAHLRDLAAAGRLGLGWLGWLAVACGWLLAVAVVRHAGHTGTAITTVQLVPTVALLLGLAALLELAGAPFDPGDPTAIGAGAALALVRAIDAAPPPALAVTLLLQGAGAAEGVGLRHHLRAHRRELRAGPVAVLGIGPCTGGGPRWWWSDGPLWPLRAHPRLRALAARASPVSAGPADRPPSAAALPGLRGRGQDPALPARLAGLPAIAIGCPGRGAPPAIDALIAFGLSFVDALDADRRPPRVAGERP
jgi:hypothetical protein